MDAKGWAASATAAYEAAITSKGADALYTLKQAVVLQILTREFIAQVGAVLLLLSADSQFYLGFYGVVEHDCFKVQLVSSGSGRGFG